MCDESIKSIHQDILKFRSWIDFRRKSWLFSEQHHYTGIYKTPQNFYYALKWSPKYDYVFEDGMEQIRISPTSWSLPFDLEIERKALSKTNSQEVLAFGLQSFFSHFIDCVEHIYLEIDVIKFELDGRPVFFQDPSSPCWERLKYTEQRINMDEIFDEYSLIGESGHYDVVCGEAAENRPMEAPWRFLIDSIAAFHSGHFHSCVVYACFAVELEVVPVVLDWLSDNTLTQPSDLLEKALVDLSNPTKFEIFFGCEKVHALDALTRSQRASLLKELKWLNSIRNRVVHSGYDVQTHEARRAIRGAGLLLRVLWVYKKQMEFQRYGVTDVFSDFQSKMRKIRL